MSPTLVNLVEDHGGEEYYLYWYDAFWEAQSKAMRAWTISYHCGES